MKNLSLILNIVLLVAVAALFVLHFTADSTDSQAESSVDTVAVKKPTLKIAYVNSDSLLSKYNYFSELEEGLKSQQQRMEAEYRRRATSLQQEIANFQKNAASMGMQKAQAKEKELMQKQQNLMQYQEQSSQRLIEQESDLNEKLYKKVSEYLSGYAKTHDIELILTYTQNSGVLYANDSMNITEQVITNLNQEYADEQKAESQEDQ